MSWALTMLQHWIVFLPYPKTKNCIGGGGGGGWRWGGIPNESSFLKCMNAL